MKTLLSLQEFISQQKNIILFVGCGIFAIQALVFISSFGINFTQYGDDWLIPKSADMITSEYIWNNLLNEIDSHIAIFPKLLILISYFIDNLNFVHLMYIGWAILAISLVYHFKIIQSIDKRLTWIILPVAALVFSPLQHFALVSAYVGLQWELTMLGIVVSVYYLNKKPYNKKSFLLAIFSSLVASYTLISGLISWVIGVISISKKIKKMIVWLSIAAAVIFSYTFFAKSIESTSNFSNLMSIDGLTYFLTFVSIPFRLKFPELNLLAGIGTTILLICLISYFLKNKKQNSNVQPYIQFTVAGFLISIMHLIGRFGDVETKAWLFGHSTYYAVIANLPQIALMALLSILVLKFWSSRKKLAMVLLLIIILQVIFIIPGYYLGWQWGDEYFQKNSEKYSCFSQSPKNVFLCNEIFDSKLQLVHNAKYLLEHNLSIFTNNEFNSDYIFTASEINKQWNDNVNSQKGVGYIETVNDMPVSNNETVTISTDHVNVRGVINQEAYEFESIILLKNGKPFAKFDAISNEPVIMWEFTFLTGYVDGCEEITINGITGDTNVTIDKSIIICK